MYGIVNKEIGNLVIADFGEEKWDAIKLRSGVDIDFFMSNEFYDDEITFDLLTAFSEEMNIAFENILITFGEWWAMKNMSKTYLGLMHSGGVKLKDFLINLPNFYNREKFIYPKLTPPEFKVSNVEETSVHLHYFSKREGLQEFIRGVIQGIGKVCETNVNIELLQSRKEGGSHEIFKISW